MMNFQVLSLWKNLNLILPHFILCHVNRAVQLDLCLFAFENHIIVFILAFDYVPLSMLPSCYISCLKLRSSRARSEALWVPGCIQHGILSQVGIQEYINVFS